MLTGSTALPHVRRRSGSGHRVATLVASTVYLAMSAVYVYLAVALPGGPDGMSDLGVYTGAVRSALEGGSLYGHASANGDQFVYPPFAGLVFVPLALLPETVARVGWTLVQCVQVVVLAWAVVVRADQPLLRRAPRRVAVPVLACLLLVAQPVFTGLFLGQVSLLVTLLALLDALDLTPPRLRGVATGVAAAIKLTPLAFLPYLWFTERRQAAVTGALTFVGATALASLVWSEPALRPWTLVLATPEFIDLGQPDNQSLRGLAARLGWTDATGRLALLAALLLVVVAAYRRSARLHARGRVLAGALVVGAMVVLVSPISWNHHQTTLTLVAACCLASGARRLNTAWLVGVLALTSFPVQLALQHAPPPPALLTANTALLLAVLVACVLPFQTADPRG